MSEPTRLPACTTCGHLHAGPCVRPVGELGDPARQGESLLRVGNGAYVPKLGMTPCAKCGEVKPALYGHPDAPVCKPCVSVILDEWAAARVAEMRAALGLDPL